MDEIGRNILRVLKLFTGKKRPVRDTGQTDERDLQTTLAGFLLYSRRNHYLLWFTLTGKTQHITDIQQNTVYRSGIKKGFGA